MKNAAMCAHARHARFLVFQLVPMTLQEMPKVVREHRPFVEVRVLNSSTSEMTQATSVDVFSRFQVALQQNGMAIAYASKDLQVP